MYIEKINAQDEILEGSPKYNITDNADGTKNIELANTVIQEGSALNKVIFDKVDEGFRKLSLKSIGNTYLAYINSELYDLEAYS